MIIKLIVLTFFLVFNLHSTEKKMQDQEIENLIKSNSHFEDLNFWQMTSQTRKLDKACAEFMEHVERMQKSIGKLKFLQV